MFNILLVRHADPDYENDTITRLGHAQAEALAEALADVAIDAIYCSPLGRARDTMQYVARRTGLTSTTLDWLRELDGRYGRDDEGADLWAWNCTAPGTLARGPATLENWSDHVPYGKKMAVVAAELYRQFDEFMAGFGLQRDGARYKVNGKPEGTIALFCHEGLIKTLMPHLIHMPLPVVYSQVSVCPSSRTSFAFEVEDGFGAFRAMTINDCSHYHDCRQRNH
jgi:probable phosphoglycerate mutase